MHGDFDVAAMDDLAGAYLCRLAIFRLAIHRHLAGGDQRLALAATVGNAAELEQVAELDVFATQFKFNMLQ